MHAKLSTITCDTNSSDNFPLNWCLCMCTFHKVRPSQLAFFLSFIHFFSKCDFVKLYIYQLKWIGSPRNLAVHIHSFYYFFFAFSKVASDDKCSYQRSQMSLYLSFSVSLHNMCIHWEYHDDPLSTLKWVFPHINVRERFLQIYCVCVHVFVHWDSCR